MELLLFFLLTSSVFVAGQRPFYAGSQPIGVYVPPNLTTTTEVLGDRVGEDGEVTTLRPLPIEANGNRELIDMLSKLPIENQPFWFINWQALDEHRKNPQNYPQRPNTFINPIPPNPSVISNSESSTVNSKSEILSLNSELGTSSTAATVSTVAITNINSGSSKDNAPVTNSPNTSVTTTTEIRSTKFENKESDIRITSSVPNSELITENPSGFTNSVVESSSSLPTSNSEIKI